MATKVFPTAMTGIDPALSDQIMLADDSNGDKASKTTLNELQSLFLKETDRRLYSHIGTSRIYGGDLSINADNTKFDVTAGFGRKSDSYTDPGDPDVEPISWPDFIGVSTPYISVSPATFVAVDSDSSLVLSPFQFTSSQLKDVLFLGVVVHVNFIAITKALAYFSYIYDWNDWFFNFSVRFKSFLNNGLNFKANGPNLYLDITAGDSFAIGLNYVDDPKNPNVKTISEQTRVGFSLATRDSIVGFSDSVDVTQYDLNGVLTTIPDGYFTTHRLIFDSVTGSVGLQYGQSVYENLKKAVLSADKEEYVYNPFAETIPTRSILAVQKNATDLTDLDQQRFINLNQINDAGLSQVCGFSNFADNIEIIEGMSYQRQTLYYVEDGGVFYVDIEAVNGGDITFVFGQREFTLDCTTGSGVNGRARIALTEGTFQVPKKNWVYVIRSGEAAVLQQAATEPTGAYSMMFTAFIPSVAESLAHGFYNSRRWTDTKEIDGRGAVITMLSKLRDLTPYKSGLAANITIDTGPSPDSVDFTVEAGVVREIYNQDIDALQLSVDTALVVNGFTNTYEEVSDLNQIITDSNGNTLNNKYYQIVVGVSLNADGHPNRLIINKPSGSYGSAAAAFFDTNGYSNTNFADGFKSVYLLFAAVLKTQGGNQITNEALAFGVNNIDLRLVTPGGASSGAGTAAVTEFSDSLFRIYYNLNSLTGIKFDLSGITPNLDRTYTAPNASGILALTSQTDGSIDHGIDLTGLSDDDHAQYALLAGRNGNILSIDDIQEYNSGVGVTVDGLEVKDGGLTAISPIISSLAIGTAPFTITSTTLNTNLNSDLLDGQHGSYYPARANHTGTQTASTISDFDAEVSNNTDVAANTAHRTSDGTDHTYIDQSVTQGASPTFTAIQTDTITEKNVNNGVMVETVELKDGSVTVPGNLFVNGEKVAVDSRISTSDYILAMNFGETSSVVTSGLSGIETDRGSGDPYINAFFEATQDYRVGMYYTTLNYTGKTGTFSLNDEIEGVTSGATGYVVSDSGSALKLKVVKGTFIDTETVNNNTVSGSAAVNGTPVITNDTVALAGREDAPVNNALAFWDSSNTIFETDANLTWDGTELKVPGAIESIIAGVHEFNVSTPAGQTGFILNANSLGNRSRFDFVNRDNAVQANRYVAMYYSADSIDSGLNIRKGGKVGFGLSAPTAQVDIKGSATAASNSLRLRSGDSGSEQNVNQILFSYNNGTLYTHAVKTRHNSGADAGNAICFYVWDHGTDASVDVGTKRVLSLENGAIDVAGNIVVSGTVDGIDVGIDVVANTAHRGLTNNPHTVTKTQVGLGNVDNTSDINKPVSTATQTALDLKADDNAVVHLAGNESIGGIKTFTSFPVGPSAAPTTDYQFANKKYVDDSTGTVIPDSTAQYSTLVANAVGGWVEDTSFKVNSGSITTATNGTFSGTVTGGTFTDGTLSISSGSINAASSIGATGTITGLTLSDLSLTITGGSISNAHNGTFSGTLQAEQLTSTDDASIAGYTRMGSGNTATKKQIKTGTTPSAGSTSNLSIYASSRTKVIGIDMLVDAANGLQIPPNNGNLANSSYNVYINTSGNLAIRPSSAQTNVANRPFRAAITYIE